MRRVWNYQPFYLIRGQFTIDELLDVQGLPTAYHQAQVL
jgi:hypothetical protein